MQHGTIDSRCFCFCRVYFTFSIYPLKFNGYIEKDLHILFKMTTLAPETVKMHSHDTSCDSSELLFF